MLPCSVCRNRKFLLSFRKLWQSGDCTYDCGVCGVTPARDVTSQMMTTANAGTRVAAGVSSRCLGLAAQVFFLGADNRDHCRILHSKCSHIARLESQKLHEGSVVQVGSGNSCAGVHCLEGGNRLQLRLAGQGSPGPFELGWSPSTINDERTDRDEVTTGGKTRAKYPTANGRGNQDAI